MELAWLVLPPLLVPFAGVVVTLFIRKRPAQHTGLVALGFMLASLVATSGLTWTVLTTGQALVVQPGDWPAPMGITLVGDPLSVFMLFMAQLVLTLGVVYSLGSTEKAVHYPTYYPVFMGLATGLSGAFLTGDMLNLFVFAEVIVISGAVLTSIADDALGAEAAYKYILISTLASMLFLLAIGALYAGFGTLNMAHLSRLIARTPTEPLAMAGLALLTATFFIKGAVFPFHFWQPDFHAVAPTAVSAMLSSLVVKVGVYGLMRATTLLFVEYAAALSTVLIVAGLAGMVVGGLAAIRTYNVKRVLAYSTLGQVGYMLIGLGLGTPLGLLTALVAAFNHSVIKSAMLMLAGAVASRAPIKSANFEVIGGLGKYLPGLGALFFLGGMGLAGLPPTNGFISKMLLFRGAAQAGEWVALALVGVSGLISLIYVTRAFMRIWWEPLPEGHKAKPTGDGWLAPAILIGLCVMLGLWSEPLLAAAQVTAHWLSQPELYIRAVMPPAP